MNTLNEIFAELPDAPKRETVQEAELRRLRCAFSEINDFRAKNGREPFKNTASIGEYQLGARLHALRGNEVHKAALKADDQYQLL